MPTDRSRSIGGGGGFGVPWMVVPYLCAGVIGGGGMSE